MYIYSAKNNAFHPIELKQRYIDAGSWPDDGVEISDEDYYRFINAVNKRWVAGDNGYPKLVDIPPPSPAKLQQQAKQQKLSLRQRADIAIAPLQYAVDLDMATDVELSMLDSVVMRYLTKEQGNGFGPRQETMHYFWHSGLLCHASV
ncbi:tail fiber assembly protein [Xenorhabdus thailandensis]|uniref:tail fiber assembly protein n=1 Tax=Xenorhabdus thailandensis TaxID=3136255 RepID=UPI0030F38D75